MSLHTLIFCEMLHRWKSSLFTVVLVAAITGVVTYFAVNDRGFQKEVIRNARDIGSNVVILPASVNQVEYHLNGGYAPDSMPDAVVAQLIEYRASLNHLIPMLERNASVRFQGKSNDARIVGIAASIPMPGRPKSPMQRAIAEGKVQLGSQVAAELGIQRDQPALVTINDTEFEIERVNSDSGTWQDAAVLMDLAAAQTLFDLPEMISRIEAIECTSEECARTGLTSDLVLANELARISDQVAILRRAKMAEARSSIRQLSRSNLALLQNALWVSLTLSIIALSAFNSLQRQSEIGILQAVGYGWHRVATMFVARAVLLTLVGSLVGVILGAGLSHWQSLELFRSTGKSFSVDWTASLMIGAAATVLSALAACLPAIILATRHPADIIGKEN